MRHTSDTHLLYDSARLFVRSIRKNAMIRRLDDHLQAGCNLQREVMRKGDQAPRLSFKKLNLNIFINKNFVLQD